jgi:hypothetical protein
MQKRVYNLLAYTGTTCGFCCNPVLPVPRGWTGEEQPNTPQLCLVCCRERIVAMATFYSLLSFMSVNGFEYSDSDSFDILSNLPLELAITILR